ncbi:chemotaxis protein CheR [Schleiferia thermophila str. Yellowstone]|jgi:chemotaxis methyl-accepting protein methylase|uniref:CheR family methyltransferase n=2 Tax=Schleiferia thermophila TaxID=884107 RepID=UPI0004E63CE4|nr:CheR family methyltransferase [Schleiferia thermophila]KFD39876.1 chemotaxis protein CheR [Schleiferia thermophila str. Yellowstone]
MNESLNRLAESILSVMGIYIANDRFEHLEKVIAQASKELGLDNDVQTWISGLSGKESDLYVKTLAKYLTIGETYFFREEETMQFIREIIVEEVQNRIKTKTNLPYKIWCAACSTGEEPYSIAVILHSAIKELTNDKVKILGTDINPSAIESAKRGIYREWSFRTTTDDIKNQYFIRLGKEYAVNDEIKSFVTFNYHNLKSDTFPCQNIFFSGKEYFDLIICRNVFIYFDKITIASTVQKLSECLADTGWFITSQTELNEEYLKYFKKLNFKKSYFYKKCTLPFSDISKSLVLKSDENRFNTLKISKSSHVSDDIISIKRPSDWKKNRLYSRSNSDHFNDTEMTENQNLQISTARVDYTIMKQDLYLDALKYGEKGDLEKKEKTLEEILLHQPEHFLARYEYVNCLLKKNKVSEARSQLEILFEKLDKLSDNLQIDEWITVGSLKFLCNDLITKL